MGRKVPKSQQNKFSAKIYLLVYAIIIGIFLGLGSVALGYSMGEMNRENTITATENDAQGVIGLDHENEVNSNRDGELLLTVTNNFDEETKDVTFTLQEDSSEVVTFSDTATTQVDYTLAPGEEQEVRIDVDQGANNEIDFVEISVLSTNPTTGTNVFFERAETEVSNPGRGGGGGGGGGGGESCERTASTDRIWMCAGTQNEQGNTVTSVFEVEDEEEMLDTVEIEGVEENGERELIDSEEVDVNGFEDEGEAELEEDGGQENIDTVIVTVTTEDGEELSVEVEIE